MKEYINLTFENVFFSWKRLEANGREKVDAELRALIDMCKGCRKVANTMIKHYSALYTSWTSEDANNFPIITQFFGELKNYSEEAYAFMTEGYDLANIKEYLLFDKKGEFEIMLTLFGINEYVIYLRHALLKIFDESDEAKKRSMLRGLLGM